MKFKNTLFCCSLLIFFNLWFSICNQRLPTPPILPTDRHCVRYKFFVLHCIVLLVMVLVVVDCCRRRRSPVRSPFKSLVDEFSRWLLTHCTYQWHRSLQPTRWTSSNSFIHTPHRWQVGSRILCHRRTLGYWWGGGSENSPWIMLCYRFYATVLSCWVF